MSRFPLYATSDLVLETAFDWLVALLINSCASRNCSSAKVETQPEEDPSWKSYVIADAGLDTAVISLLVFLLVVSLICGCGCSGIQVTASRPAMMEALRWLTGVLEWWCRRG